MIDWISIIQDTLMITSFVIIMMLLIEFINATSHGSITKLLNKNSYIQIIGSTILGLIPGCVGTFAVVSLYSQRVVTFGALIATMIATTGDEAFFILTLIPKQTFILFTILGALSIIAGIIADKVFKSKTFIKENTGLILDTHNHDCSGSNINGKMLSFKNLSISRYRIYILAIITGVIILALTGWIKHSHSEKLLFSLPSKENTTVANTNHLPSHLNKQECNVEECNSHHEHNANSEHSHNHNHSHSHGKIDTIKIIIITCSILLLIITLFSNEHFIKEHLWEHVIKKHLLKIFLWVLGTMIATSLILNITNFGNWIYNNMFIILLIALIIGIIPQSGPHLIFLLLYIQGSIPFSILLANSIVQNGHGALPLLAESKKSFVIMKLISIALGLIAGSFVLLLGF